MCEKKLIRDRSSIEPAQFVFLHIAYSLFLVIMSKTLFFVCMDGMTVTKSRFVFAGCLIMTSVIGIVVRWRREMSKSNVLFDILSGAGLYICLSCFSFYKKYFIVILSVTTAICFIHFFMIFLQKCRGKRIFEICNQKRKRLIIIRLYFCVSRCIAVVAIGMTILAVPVIYNKVLNGGIVSSGISNLKVAQNDGSRRYYEPVIDEISAIADQDKWMSLSEMEKLRIFQILVDYETAYLGVSPIKCVLAEMDNSFTAASYLISERIIKVNIGFIKTASNEDIISALTHEVYHAYEYALILLYLDADENNRRLHIFNHVDEYINEFQDYHSEDEEYYDQYCEKDSRAYSNAAVDVILFEISYILQKMN